MSAKYYETFKAISTAIELTPDHLRDIKLIYEEKMSAPICLFEFGRFFFFSLCMNVHVFVQFDSNKIASKVEWLCNMTVTRFYKVSSLHLKQDKEFFFSTVKRKVACNCWKENCSKSLGKIFLFFFFYHCKTNLYFRE